MGNEPVAVNGAEKEGRFSRFFQFLPDAVFVARAADSVVLDINEAFEALTGYGPDAIVGRPAMSLVFFLDPDLWTRVRQEIDATGEVRDLETRLLRKDGRIAFVRISMRRLEIDGNSCDLATIHDISGRGILEQEGRSAATSGLESLHFPDAEMDREEVGRLIDFQALQDLMNSFHKTTTIPTAITDVNGNVQVATGWQEICTRFHRIHPETFANCRESDISLSTCIKEGEFSLYKCKNGMWDLASPIIIGGRHIANIFLGQFLFDDEVPDYEFFRQQAQRYGFDTEEYLAALDRVPRWSRELVHNVMEFYAKLAMLVSRLSIGNIRLTRALAEQKKVEEELLSYKSCIENAGIGIFQTEEERILSANEFACRSLGYTEDELRAMSVFDIDPILTTDRIHEIKEMLDTSGSITHQTMHRRRDGTSFPVEITTNTVPFRGRQLGVSFVKDITEQKQAEEALRAKTEELDRYFTHALDLFCIADTDGYFRRLNREWETTLGYSLAELEGARFLDYVHPDDLDATLATVARLGDHEEVLNFANRFRAKDGSYRWIEWRSFSVGKLIYAAARDITERTKAEEALRESEEKFRVLSETSPAAIALYQGEEVIYINPTAARLIGYTEEELSRISFWGCVHDDFKEMVRERGLARMRGEPAPSQYECKFVTKDGRELWTIISVGRIEFKGKPAGIVTLIDRTEAKAAEELIRASLAEKEVLLKEVHHRVKNNLQIISTLLMLQSENVEDEKLLRSFRDSQDRITSMALIHERLYKSSDFASIDFAEYIGNLATSLFDSYVVEAGRISLHVDAGDMTLDIDRAIPCGLIINELVSNSLKYAFPDNRAGEILIRFHADQGDRITLTVADTGIGMPPGLDFRNTETLGLQLVCMLVTQLEGRIDVAAEQVGTVVSISFPGYSFP